MLRTYDVFEILPDENLIWRATIEGHESAIEKFKQVATGGANEFRLMHLATKTVIATINAKTS
jgi:hypothetical protein